MRLQSHVEKRLAVPIVATLPDSFDNSDSLSFISPSLLNLFNIKGPQVAIVAFLLYRGYSNYKIIY